VQDSYVQTTRNLAERITAGRKQRGWSQETLAVEAKVSPSCIQHLEHGRSTPTIITLLKLTAALGMDLPDLLRDAQKVAGAKKQKPRS
jgi:ribosome-binding protein aMBF1 (putative translation factor)